MQYNRSDMPPLTDEQQAIVDHDCGPALVFAVAGAGKTTAMTHRVERLVRESVFPARNILATSFSKASAQDIKTALAVWPHCQGVNVQTLHAVGWGLLRLAQRQGHLRQLELSPEDEGGESQLLGRVLGRAWRDKVPYTADLEALDRQDFLTYVGVCKANLWYADLERADLPPAARTLARQAPAPPGFPWYRDLYGLYERVRADERLLTFDDMLLSAWEALHRFPDVLAGARRRFGCVLVDEFQDVNRVQSELLDLLTFPQRDYMAIGDDDQTIYEWRGADPSLILSFAARYGARRYLIRDNFRSHAGPLALANRVIAHNVRREPKRLSLTRGFGGGVWVHSETSHEAQGRHVAALVGEAQAAGRRPSEIAILVRLYAQTPFLEQGLLDAGLAYKIVGGSPFYARPEVLTLLDYLHLARAETDLAGGQPMLDGWEARWMRVANRPVRFLSRVASEAIAQAVKRGDTLARALEDAATRSPDHLAARLRDLAETLTWLAGTLDSLPAGAALTLLDIKTGYGDWLRRSSGFAETGAARAAGVAAFLRYAEGQGTPRALMAHLEDLTARGVGSGRAAGADGAVSVLTVFRAKGLQWPVVFVPDCNGGVFPTGGPDELEEERRLFYVALTRTQSALHLHTVGTEPPSPFLRETDWEATLAAVRRVGDVLARPPADWPTADALALTRLTPMLNLERFFQTWWAVPPARALAVARRIQLLLAAAHRLGLEGRLGLDESHAAAWADFGPSPAADADPDAFPDLADHVAPAPLPCPPPAYTPTPAGIAALRIGTSVQHPQHGTGTVLAIRGDRLSPRLEIQFARGRPVTLPAKFVEFV